MAAHRNLNPSAAAGNFELNVLTLLCITAHQPYSLPFVEQFDEDAREIGARLRVVDGTNAGFIEAVLDEAIHDVPDGYVLRVDDDERMSRPMVEWLAAGEYESADHWAFPRANLWPDEDRYIVNAPLWPDLQTRLSVKEKAGGRTQVHEGSPFGTGHVANVLLEHHKFLVRDRAEREALVHHYESLQRGAGEAYAMFSVPELFEDVLECRELEGVTA